MSTPYFLKDNFSKANQNYNFSKKKIISQKWLKLLIDNSQIHLKRIIESTIIKEISAGTFSVEQLRFVIKNFYPLVSSFPQYLDLMVAKIPADNKKRSVLAHKWLIENLKVEQNHTSWFVDFAAGFGVPRSEFSESFSPPGKMNALNNYLQKICEHGTFAECLGAVNFAIEGPTGEWTKSAKQGFRKYKGKPGIPFGPGTMTWIDAHAIYDDDHVVNAIKLMGLFARTKAEQDKVTSATIRSLEYYAMAVESCYELSKKYAV